MRVDRVTKKCVEKEGHKLTVRDRKPLASSDITANSAEAEGAKSSEIFERQERLNHSPC